MRKLRVITATVLFIAVCIACFTGCSAKYNEDEIIGKRSDEIINSRAVQTGRKQIYEKQK